MLSQTYVCSFYAFNRLLHQQIAEIEKREAAKGQKWYAVMQEAEKKSGYRLGGTLFPSITQGPLFIS